MGYIESCEWVLGLIVSDQSSYPFIDNIELIKVITPEICSIARYLILPLQEYSVLPNVLIH